MIANAFSRATRVLESDMAPNLSFKANTESSKSDESKDCGADRKQISAREFSSIFLSGIWDQS